MTRLALLLLLIGCASPKDACKPTDVVGMGKATYYADPEFTVEERQGLEEGVRIAEQLADLMTIRVEYGPGNPHIYRANSSGVEDPPGITLLGECNRDGNIKLFVDRLSPVTMPNNVAHEIGHSLGFKHSKDEYSIMCGWPESPNCAAVEDRRILPSDKETCLNKCLCAGGK